MTDLKALNIRLDDALLDDAISITTEKRELGYTSTVELRTADDSELVVEYIHSVDACGKTTFGVHINGKPYLWSNSMQDPEDYANYCVAVQRVRRHATERGLAESRERGAKAMRIGHELFGNLELMMDEMRDAEAQV